MLRYNTSLSAFPWVLPTLHAAPTWIFAERSPSAPLWPATVWPFPQEYWTDAGAGTCLLENWIHQEDGARRARSSCIVGGGECMVNITADWQAYFSCLVSTTLLSSLRSSMPTVFGTAMERKGRGHTTPPTAAWRSSSPMHLGKGIAMVISWNCSHTVLPWWRVTCETMVTSCNPRDIVTMVTSCKEVTITTQNYHGYDWVVTEVCEHWPHSHTALIPVRSINSTS